MSHVFFAIAQTFGDPTGWIFFPLFLGGVLILAWIYGKLSTDRGGSGDPDEEAADGEGSGGDNS